MRKTVIRTAGTEEAPAHTPVNTTAPTQLQESELDAFPHSA